MTLLKNKKTLFQRTPQMGSNSKSVKSYDRRKKIKKLICTPGIELSLSLILFSDSINLNDLFMRNQNLYKIYYFDNFVFIFYNCYKYNKLFQIKWNCFLLFDK